MTTNEIGALRLHHVARTHIDPKQRAEILGREDERGTKEGRRKERKEGSKTPRKDARPGSFATTRQDRWSAIEGPRREDPSFDLHTSPRARIKTCAACRLPVLRSLRRGRSFKLSLGSLGKFLRAQFMEAKPAGHAINSLYSRCECVHTYIHERTERAHM